MKVQRIDPRSLDSRTADQLAEAKNASAKAAGLDVPTLTGASVVAEARYTHDDRPYDAMWLVREDGDAVGMASLELPRWDNPHMALGFCAVHPNVQRRGLGTQLLRAQTAWCRERGRSLLLTFGMRGTPGEDLLLEYGFELAQPMARRRLCPRRLDYEHIQALADEAAAKADEYELVRLDGPAPEEWLPGLVSLFEAMNDAPTDAMATTPDVYPVERLRAYDAAMSHRRQHVYRLMARHVPTGEWAGHTIVCVNEHAPGTAMQEDTTVVKAHRGHRLGMWLKAAMLLWLRDEQPGLETIDTWNAESNHHMIAVNDELGCVLKGRGQALQLHL